MKERVLLETEMTKTGSRFLDLAKELRDIVYGMLVADCSKRQNQWNFPVNGKKVRSGCAMVFVCKQVSDEFLAEAFRLSSVLVSVRTTDPRLRDGNCEALVRYMVSGLVLSSVRRVRVFIDAMDTEWCWVCGFIQGFMSLTGRLQEIEVDVCNFKSESELSHVVDDILKVIRAHNTLRKVNLRAHLGIQWLSWKFVAEERSEGSTQWNRVSRWKSLEERFGTPFMSYVISDSRKGLIA